MSETLQLIVGGVLGVSFSITILWFFLKEARDQERWHSEIRKRLDGDKKQ